MSQENVDVVRRGFEAYARGDLPTALAGFDPEIAWSPVEESSFQGIGAVRSYLARWEDVWEDYEMQAEEYLDAGDRVVVALHFRGRGKGSGVETEARSFQVYTVRNGKTVSVLEYLNRAEALEAAGLDSSF
jgi:ketosteroid isomerase-like protein